MANRMSNISDSSFRVQRYTFLQNDYMEKKKLNLNFLILSISFNIGMIFLELFTTHADGTNILVPIVAVAPIGVLRFPFQLEIFAVSAEVDRWNVRLWRW